MGFITPDELVRKYLKRDPREYAIERISDSLDISRDGRRSRSVVYDEEEFQRKLASQYHITYKDVWDYRASKRKKRR